METQGLNSGLDSGEGSGVDSGVDLRSGFLRDSDVGSSSVAPARCASVIDADYNASQKFFCYESGCKCKSAFHSRIVKKLSFDINKREVKASESVVRIVDDEKQAY